MKSCWGSFFTTWLPCALRVTLPLALVNFYQYSLLVTTALSDLRMKSLLEKFNRTSESSPVRILPRPFSACQYPGRGESNVDAGAFAGFAGYDKFCPVGFDQRFGQRQAKSGSLNI